MTETELSSAVIPLMKGAVYRDTHDRAWKQLLQLQPQVRDYVAVLGLQVVIDEAEGYAFLRQRPVDPDTVNPATGDPPPRLIPRHALSFHVSLLLVDREGLPRFRRGHHQAPQAAEGGERSRGPRRVSRVQQGLPPPPRHRVRAGDGAVPPDRVHEVGRQPDRLRPRAHARAVFNAAKATRDIVAHFDHLTSAHEAVLRAKAQIDALTPLLANCDEHDRLNREIAVLNEQREALRYFFADHKVRLASELLARLHAERMRLTVRRQQLDEELTNLRAGETGLQVRIAGHGGSRLAEIERRIAELRAERSKLQAASQTLARLTAELEELRDQIGKADARRAEAGERLGGVNSAISGAKATVDEGQAILDEPAGGSAKAHFDAIRALIAGAGQVRLRGQRPGEP